MGIENSGVPTFNENLSKSFKLVDSFRRGEVFGEKSGEETIKANQKVTEILNSSFQVGFESEGQYNNISQYESVAKMIEISKPEGGRTPRAQENAKNSLFEVGLALSQNKEVLKAATEGTDQLNKILPSNLHEIQPYILSVILTNGKDDVQGQGLVSELVDLFKLKNRADRNPSVYKDDYSEAYKKITVKLDDIYDDLDSKSRIDGTEGRIETMRGYVFDINEENNSSDMTEKMVKATEKQTGRPKFSKEKNENDDEYVDSRSRLKKLDWENPIEVLKYSKDLLDTLENSFYKSNDISMGDTTRNLNIVLDQMRLRMENENGSIFKDIYKEVDSRLALHDSEFYMEDSGFKISDRGGGIGGAVENIYREKRELNKDRLKFLLIDAGSEKNGLPINKAWDKIQEANFDYKNLLIKVANDLGYQEGSADREILINIKKVSEPYGKGTTVGNRDIGYWLDNDDERKTKVDAYIIKEISILKSNGEKMDGKKAYQLAKKMVGATGERSVFNFGLVNGDDFAEDIHFGYFRADDARKGKNVGPLSTMGIKTLTPGWLRSMSGKDINHQILSAEIDFDNNEGKSTFGYYYTQILPAKIHALRSVLLDNSPDPKKMLASGAGYFNGIVDAFNKVEPSFDLIKIPNEGYLSIKTVKENGKKRFFVKNNDGTEREGLRVIENKSIEGFDVMTNDGRLIGKTEKSREGENNLRSMYALGLLELIATKPSLGWTADNIMDLRKFMVETKLSTAKSFLNEGMWDWINNQVVANDNNRNYTFRQALVYNRRISVRKSFWNGFLKGVSGQKK